MKNTVANIGQIPANAGKWAWLNKDNGLGCGGWIDGYVADRSAWFMLL